MGLTRLERYRSFINHEFVAGLLKPHEYTMDKMSPDLARRIGAGEFRRIIFTGMGCSAIVSDMLRGFLIARGANVEVFVLNDYDATFLLPTHIVEDESTLIVISSYSGHSREPIIALERLSTRKDRVVLLTSGGQLPDCGRQLGVSTIYWRLRNPGREYPLFHVTQHFSILLDVFHRLGLLPDNYQGELADLATELSRGTPKREVLARAIAERSYDANIVPFASPKWHETFQKLCKMHLNEMAMVPATPNYLHEFCHGEVASLSDPRRRHSLRAFLDCKDDAYTRKKVENLMALLTSDRPENTMVEVTRIDLYQPTFLARLFAGLDMIQRLTFALGIRTDTASRELISEAASSRWYHLTTIERERPIEVA